MHRVTPQMVKLLLSRFAGTFGSSMLAFAIGLYILRRTGSALGMGVTMITGPLVSLALTPFVGYAVDNWAHRRLMVCAQVGTTVGLIAFALAFALWPGAYYQELIALIIVLQIADNFFGTTLSASLVQLFEGDELQRVNALNQSLQSLAGFLAPVVGALVYTWVSIGQFALIEVGFELVALAGILALRFDVGPQATPVAPAAAAAPKPTVWQNFVEGFRYLVGARLILLVFLTSAGINFFAAALNVGLPYMMIQTLHLSNNQYGWTEAAFAIGMFLGGLLLSQLTLRRHPILVSFTWLMVIGVFTFFYALPTLTGWSSGLNTTVYIVLNVLQGGSLVFINAPVGTFMQQQIPPAVQGRVFSLSGTVATLLMPLGTLLYGVLFDRVAALPILGVTALTMITLTTCSMVYMHRHHLLTPAPAKSSAA
ncbi:MFS transporter [Lacticaseibacillus absianus]|uniref:MFS transporter n=1 Tax=Lacticaseibacillus absianus TaxID=2729623 RepID=UPI0015CC6482|nr:MFS transporter [Lacticaseibacillus absianus]